MLGPLSATDVAEAAALSAQFGWPHRPEDWAWFLRLGHGFGWREDGRLGGTAMWFPLGDAHASIGLVQVAPDRQGRGIGRALMRAVLQAAGDRSLTLHATAEGAGLYASLGFTPGDVVQQWQGMAHAVQANSDKIRFASRSDRAEIARLDLAATGIRRPSILNPLLDDGVVAIAGPPGAATGYAVRRDFGRGALIGPVIAADAGTGAALAQFLVRPGFLRLDLSGPALTEWAKANGLVCVGEVQAMTTGDWPAGSGPALRAALASQALG